MITENPDAPLSRNDLILWINDLLKLNLTRIEQLGTGAVHCQLLDVIYPGKVPLHKVNWRAKFEYEFVYNFKILQQSFTKFNIPKYIDVEKLIKVKYQDNLEFAQWMKKFFQANCNNWKDYDPAARRGNIEADFSFIDKAVSTKPTVTKDSVGKGSVISKQKSIIAPKALGMKVDSLNTSKYTGGSNSNSGSTTNLFANLTNKENEFLADINMMMERQKTAEKSPQLDILKAERDFYYFKLRDIDHILDVYKDSNVETLINNIREVLYMTPEKIAIVLEDGNIKIKNKSEEPLSQEQSAEKVRPNGQDEIREEVHEQMKMFESNMNIEDENLLV